MLDNANVANIGTLRKFLNVANIQTLSKYITLGWRESRDKLAPGE